MMFFVVGFSGNALLRKSVFSCCQVASGHENKGGTDAMLWSQSGMASAIWGKLQIWRVFDLVI
jgi:hypothetical protein